MTDKDSHTQPANLSTLFVSSIVGLAIVAVLTMISVFIYAPYYSFAQIQSAADDGNLQRFEEYVDIAAIRASLRDELKDAIAAQVGSEDKVTPEMLDLIAQQYVGPLLEESITAQNIMRLLTGTMPFDGTRRTAHAAEVLSGKDSRPIIEKSYDGPNRFIVRASDANGTAEVLFVLLRDGLGWQLDEVRIPSLLKELRKQQLQHSGTEVASSPTSGR